MTPGGRILVAGGLALATAVGLVVLVDATQYRGEIESETGHTEVVFEVRTRHHGDPEAAAAALWLGCATAHGPSQVEGPTEIAAGTYRAALQPSLGEEARRRLRGCLHDITVERATASVGSMVNRSEPLDPDAGPPGGDAT